MRFLFIFVLIAAIVVVVGFELGWFSASSTSSNDDTAFTITIHQHSWHQDRDAFRKQAETRLDEMNTKIADLKAKAGTAGAESRDALNRSLSDLHKKYEAARAEFKDLEKTTEEHWEATKTKMGQALDDLKKGIDRAASEFK